MKHISTYDEFLNEGMFDNGIKRAHTKEVREEDNIDCLISRDFYDYLSNHYTVDEDDYLNNFCDDGVDAIWISYFNSGSVNFPTPNNNLVKLPDWYMYWIMVYFEIKGSIKSIALSKRIMEFSVYKILKIRFNIEEGNDVQTDDDCIYITDKKGKVSNKLVINLLDTIIKYMKKSVIHKKEIIKEGMFDNGIRRAHTDEVRTEDIKPLNSLEDLKSDIFNGTNGEGEDLESYEMWVNFDNEAIEKDYPTFVDAWVHSNPYNGEILDDDLYMIYLDLKDRKYTYDVIDIDEFDRDYRK